MASVVHPHPRRSADIDNTAADRRTGYPLDRASGWPPGPQTRWHAGLANLVAWLAGSNDPGGGLSRWQALIQPAATAKQRQCIRKFKWVSDDDEKIPLEFLKDGTAKVGFFKEKGAWVIATGTYS